LEVGVGEVSEEGVGSGDGVGVGSLEDVVEGLGVGSGFCVVCWVVSVVPVDASPSA